MTKQTFIEKCYKNDKGKVTLAEIPNLPVIVWLVCVIIQKVVSTGTLHDLAGVIGFGAVFTFAWMELFDGSNYFRRLLGLIVLVVTISSRI